MRKTIKIRQQEDQLIKGLITYAVIVENIGGLIRHVYDTYITRGMAEVVAKQLAKETGAHFLRTN